MLFQHPHMRQEGRIVKIFCPIGTSMYAALTLDADTRHPVRSVSVNGAHGTQAGTEAAGYAFFHIRLRRGLQEFRRLPVFPLRNIIRGLGIAVNGQRTLRAVITPLKEFYDMSGKFRNLGHVDLIGTA